MDKTFSSIIIILLLVIVLGFWWWGDIEGWWMMCGRQANSVIDESSPYIPSDRSDTFSISGNEAGDFTEITFDPFELREGEEQIIILVLKNPDEIDSVVASVRDGNGFKILNFVRFFEDKERNLAHYKISWSPQNLEPGISYPVTFEYLLKSGQKNQMALFWHSAP